MTNWARVSTLCASTNLLTIPELLLDYSPSTDRIMIDHGTQSSRNSNNNSRRIPKHRIPLLCTITSRTYSFGSSSDTLQQQHHSHLRNSNHDRDSCRKRWQQRLADTGDGCHGKPHDNTLDTKTPRHNSATTRQIHRTQVLCQPSNNHHQRLQQHIHDPQREPDRNQGTSHRRRLPHLWRRNDDSPAGPVVQQQRDHEQPNHDSDASRNSQTSLERERARGSTRAYQGSTWPWCLHASLKLIFYKKIDYQSGLSRVYGLYRLFQSLDSSWARVSWRCSHAWWSGMCSSQNVFPQYSHCLFCFVSLPHLSHFVIFVRSRWVSIIFWFNPVRRSFSESCCCPIRGSIVAGSSPADFPDSVETSGPVRSRVPRRSTPRTALVNVDQWRCSSGRSSSQSR